jgi:hypothetical protein
MERNKEFYCWIKLSPPSAAKGVDTLAQSKSPAAALFDLLGSFYPSETERLSASFRNGDVPPRLRNGMRPPGVYGGATMAGWWQLDGMFQGVSGANLKVDYAPVPGARNVAIDWIGSALGVKWLEGATTYFLISLTVSGDF